MPLTLSAGSQPWDPVWWGRSLWITPWDPASPPERPRVGKGTWHSPAVPCGPDRESRGGGWGATGGGALEQEPDWEEWGAGGGPSAPGKL